MYATLLAVTLLATPPQAPPPAGPELAPRGQLRVPRAQARPGPAAVPPLPWERIIKKCGAPCLHWARHILDAATSPGGFKLQIKGLAQAARRARRAGRLRPHHARKVKRAIGRLGLALRRMTADGLLTHRERLQLLRGIIRTGAALHRVIRINRPAAHPGHWHRALRGFRHVPSP